MAAEREETNESGFNALAPSRVPPPIAAIVRLGWAGVNGRWAHPIT